MKPYLGANLTYDKQIYNYRMIRAKRIFKNGFGILVT